MKRQLSSDEGSNEACTVISSLTHSRTAQGPQLAQLSLWFPLADDTKAGSEVNWNGVVECRGC